MTTKRKPYVREMTPTWWKSSAFYKFYMLRESTAIAVLWFSIVLIYGVFSISSVAGTVNFILFLRNPIVLVLNIITLAAALLHTKTWFDLTPKAVNIITKSGNKLDPCVLVKVMWAITIVATLVILAIALF